MNMNKPNGFGVDGPCNPKLSTGHMEVGIELVSTIDKYLVLILQTKPNSCSP